jgi:signal transduction histidine kinase
MVRPGGARDHLGIAQPPNPPTRPSDGAVTEPLPGPPTPPGGHRDAWRPPWQATEWHHPLGHRGRRHRGHLRLHALRRHPDNRVLAGICGGIAEATGIDVTLVRIGFVLLGFAFGMTVLIYAVAWLVVPIEGETSNIFSRALNDRRGIRLVIAVIPILVVFQIVVSALRIGFVGIISWPVFLAAALAILIWRNVSGPEKAWINEDVRPMLGLESGRTSRWALVVRVALGAIIGVGGIVALTLGHTTSAALRPLGGALLVIAAIVVIFGPWWLRLVRDLMSERQARALAEERTQMAAHVHDSVLQTLALIQRSSDDPLHVVRLARAQERELRAWLFEGKAPGTVGDEATTLAEGVGALQRQVEADHGVTVQVVMVGDCELTEGLRALLESAREATVNAAKWSGAPQVSLYAEVEGETVMLFVRDRGRGFDPDAVSADRQGIAQSIRARMARHGGTAAIRSSLGQGAEVELCMPVPSQASPPSPAPTVRPSR